MLERSSRVTFSPIHLHQSQRGITLIVGLILLIMLTVVGLIGFRNTTLSERMTGNAVDRNTSFQSAENAGKEALQVIEAGGFNAATLGHYNPPLTKGGDSAYWNQGAGAVLSNPAADCIAASVFSWTSCSAAVSTRYSNNAENAQYVIELLSTTASGGSTIYRYRVTSRSTGGSGDAEVVLQTIYTRVTTP